MTQAAKDTAAASAAALLIHYSFDRGGKTTEELIAEWLQEHPATWVRLAAIEALYQGRYKAVSVTHILACWKRRNQALYHFNHEFESLVCSQLPSYWQSHTIPPPIAAAIGEDSSTFPGSSPTGDRPVKPRSPIAGFGPQIDTALPDRDEIPAIAAPLPKPLSRHQAVQGSQKSDRVTGSKDSSNSAVPRRDRITSALDANGDDLLGDLWRDKPPVPAVSPNTPNATFTASARSQPPSEPSPPDFSDPSDDNPSTSPIHQFTPTAPPSDFYSRLKAVAKGLDEE